MDARWPEIGRQSTIHIRGRTICFSNHLLLDEPRSRIFTEMGSGMLDVVGILAALVDLDGRGAGGTM
jgi:hypothetical protein